VNAKESKQKNHAAKQKLGAKNTNAGLKKRKKNAGKTKRPDVLPLKQRS